MKKLKTNFNKNGLSYNLIKRSEKVAMFSAHGLDTNAIIGYEVFVIEIKTPNEYCDYAREVPPGNEMFGGIYKAKPKMIYRSAFHGGYGKRERAEEHYESLIDAVAQKAREGHLIEYH